MPSVVRSTIVLAALTLAIASAVACRGDRFGTGLELDSTVQSVTLFPPGPIHMNIGTTVAISASVAASAGVTDRGVTWSSANGSIATVDQTGIATADSVGTTTITATSKANPGISGAAIVVVASPAAGARIP